MPTAFRVTWDRVCCGKILKYDGDECSECGDVRDDLYGCSYCGSDFCEQCIMNDERWGITGYRGAVDEGHPIENHPDFTEQPYCPECAWGMISDGSLDQTTYERVLNEAADKIESYDEKMPVPPNQEVAVPENPFADMSDVELSQRLGALHGTNDPFFDELLREATRRTMQGDPDQRANMSALIEGNLNEKLRRLGQPAIVPKPPAGDRLDYGFPEGFGDKFASADAFTSAWDVVKRERI